MASAAGAAGKSRLPTPAHRSPTSPSVAAAAASIGQTPRPQQSSSNLPSIRSLKRAFQFGRSNSGNAGGKAVSTVSGLPKSSSTTALHKSLGSNASRRASGDHARKPIPSELQASKAVNGNEHGLNSWISYTSPSPNRVSTASDLPQNTASDRVGLAPVQSHTSASSGSLSQLIEAERASGSSNEMLVSPAPLRAGDALIRNSGTPPPTIPLPPVPIETEPASRKEDTIATKADSATDRLPDSYAFPYGLAADQAKRPFSTASGGRSEEESIREQEAASPEPVLAESPQKSPAVVPGEDSFIFSSAVVERSEPPDEVHPDPEMPSQEERDAELQASLTRLRHSSSSPLSELVTRLSLHSPTHSMRAASLASMSGAPSPDPRTAGADSVAHFMNASPPFSAEEDDTAAADSASVDGSSGISAAPPSKPPVISVLEHPVPKSPTHLPDRELRNDLVVPEGTRQDAAILRRVSPNTQQRWSMHELEEAYSRMRSIAISRKGSGTTDAPSLLLSEADDSRELENSYLKNLLNDVDRSELQSSQYTELASSQAKLADEAADALTPLLDSGRYSTAAQHSPFLRERSPSPREKRRSPSPGPVEGHERTDATTAPSAGSSSDSSTPSGASTRTNPTTARSSTHDVHKTPTAASVRRRSSPSDGLGIDSSANSARRKPSVEYSLAGSDDTGWQTPRSSMGEVPGRRRSVSPNLPSARRRSSTTEHELSLPARGATVGHRPRRPMSFGSGTSTESGRHPLPGTFRNGHADSPHVSATNGTLGWIDEQSRAPSSRIRANLPYEYKQSNVSSTRLREPSQTGSTFSIETGSSVTLADAKRADRLDLFLRWTKAEGAYNALHTQYNIEKAALMDAIQEYKHNAEILKETNERLEDELDDARRGTGRKQWQAKIAEIVEARDSWQARAQAAERDLQKAEAAQAKSDSEARATIASLQKELEDLKYQLAAARNGPSPGKGSSLPRAKPGSRIASSSSASGIAKLGSGLPKASVSALPHSRTTSAGSSIASLADKHGRSVSMTSSTNYGDHLPPSSDGWTPDASMDLSLHLDEKTDKYLRDLDEETVRSKQV